MPPATVLRPVPRADSGLGVHLQNGQPAEEAVSGDKVVNIDGERSLLVVRAAEGSAEAAVGTGQLSSSLAIGQFEVQDLLAGSMSLHHKHLARSFEHTASGPVQSLIRCMSQGVLKSQECVFPESKQHLFPKKPFKFTLSSKQLLVAPADSDCTGMPPTPLHGA